MTGLVHSIQTLGAVDGPGLRTVIVLQGCPLKCKFCHSVDTTLSDRGTRMESEDLVKQVITYRPYWKKYLRRKDRVDNNDPEIQGGVTITGGDPLAQPVFLLDVVRQLKEKGVHVVVETSLFTSNHVIDMLLEYVDLWMVSIKHMDNDKHLELTGKNNKSIMESLIYLDKKLIELGKESSVRIRFVVIPGLTDDKPHAKLLGRFIKNLKSLESVELLPYVTLGRFKWVELYGEYELDGIMDATYDDMKGVIEELRAQEIPLLEDNL